MTLNRLTEGSGGDNRDELSPGRLKPGSANGIRVFFYSFFLLEDAFIDIQKGDNHAY